MNETFQSIQSRTGAYQAQRFVNGWTIYKGDTIITHGLTIKQAVAIMDELDPPKCNGHIDRGYGEIRHEATCPIHGGK